MALPELGPRGYAEWTQRTLREAAPVEEECARRPWPFVRQRERLRRPWRARVEGTPPREKPGVAQRSHSRSPAAGQPPRSERGARRPQPCGEGQWRSGGAASRQLEEGTMSGDGGGRLEGRGDRGGRRGRPRGLGQRPPQQVALAGPNLQRCTESRALSELNSEAGARRFAARCGAAKRKGAAALRYAAHAGDRDE